MLAGYAFAIVAMVIIFIAFVIFVLNSWFWGQIYFGATTSMPVSQTTAGWMLVANIALAVIMLIALIYAAYVLYKTPKTSAASVTKVTEKSSTSLPSPDLPGTYMSSTTSVPPRSTLYTVSGR